MNKVNFTVLLNIVNKESRIPRPDDCEVILIIIIQ